MNDDAKTTKYWLDRHIDPSLAAKSYLDEEPDWKLGDPAAIIKTLSGAVYRIESDGGLSGGSKNVTDGTLSGATPSGSSLIRTKCVVVGLRMEFVANNKCYKSSLVESVAKD